MHQIIKICPRVKPLVTDTETDRLFLKLDNRHWVCGGKNDPFQQEILFLVFLEKSVTATASILEIKRY